MAHGGALVEHHNYQEVHYEVDDEVWRVYKKEEVPHKCLEEDHKCGVVEGDQEDHIHQTQEQVCRREQQQASQMVHGIQQV